MSVAPSAETDPSDPRPRRSWFGAAVGASVAVHILVLGWLLLPGVEALPAPGEPVNVDLVTAEEAAADSASAASEPQESGSASASSEASASSASTATASASASSASNAPPASAPSSAPASQQDARSSAPAAPSAEPAAASTPRAPTPMPRPPAPQGRVTVPVGETASSAEAASASADGSGAPASAAASEEAPAALTTTGAAAEGVADGAAASEVPSSEAPSSAEDNPPLIPIGGGALTPATRFFLEDMLAAPALSQVREAIGELPPEARLAQTCNIEAMGQATGAGFSPDAIIPNAFAAPAIVGSSYRVAGGAFRTGGDWRRIAYECRLSEDLDDVASFSFNIGADVTAEMEARLNAD